VERSVLLEGAVVHGNARVSDAILGSNVVVGDASSLLHVCRCCQAEKATPSVGRPEYGITMNLRPLYSDWSSRSWTTCSGGRFLYWTAT
jgi:NDP-sugar pyrophosphorylase family protein